MDYVLSFFQAQWDSHWAAATIRLEGYHEWVNISFKKLIEFNLFQFIKIFITLF